MLNSVLDIGYDFIFIHGEGVKQSQENISMEENNLVWLNLLFSNSMRHGMLFIMGDRDMNILKVKLVKQLLPLSVKV